MSGVTEFPDDEGASIGGKPESLEVDEGRQGFASKLPKFSFPRRIAEFYHGVKLEMRKTTWPARSEVWSTTLVVLIAVVFFGFYLFGVDWLITKGFEYLGKAFGAS